MIKKYRKLPVVVEAIKLTEQNYKDVVNFIGKDIFVKIVYVFPNGNYIDEYKLLCTPCREPNVTAPKIGLIIKTLEGELLATEDDYIIKGIKGEFYPCKPDIFEATYEECIGQESNFHKEISDNCRILEEYRNYYKKRMADITIRRQYKCQIMKLIKKLFSK